MAMQTDVRAVSLASSNTAFAGRTRLRGLLVEPGASAGSVVLKDGGASGTTVMTINTLASGQAFNVIIPAEGVIFQTDVYAALTNAKVTVFYA
jgi:hypothetical protein